MKNIVKNIMKNIRASFKRNKNNHKTWVIVDGVFLILAISVLLYCAINNWIYNLAAVAPILVFILSGFLLIADCNKISYDKETHKKDWEERRIIY